jgi:hypothetical protein
MRGRLSRRREDSAGSMWCLASCITHSEADVCNLLVIGLNEVLAASRLVTLVQRASGARFFFIIQRPRARFYSEWASLMKVAPHAFPPPPHRWPYRP